MKRVWRSAALVALVGLVLGMTAQPAAAATLTYQDPPGDGVSVFDPGPSDPRVDILGVTVDSTASALSVSLQMAEVVPLSSPAWEELLLFVDLSPDGQVDESTPLALVVSDDAGTVRAVLVAAEGARVCEGSVRVSGSAYVASFGSCVRMLSRTLSTAAVAARFTADDIFADAAPDQGLAQALSAFSGSPAAGRLAGVDRILTAIALSGDVFGPGEAGAVVLAASHTFPDALAGGPLARAVDGPLLLTPTAGLDSRVRNEISRVLRPGRTVYVLGGTAALSDDVLAQVRAAGYAAERVAGLTRFETAIEIARAVDRQPDIFGEPRGHDMVLIADGRTFPDALIAGAAAPSQWGVVVLTDGTTMPASTGGYLAGDRTEQVAIGTAAATAVGTRNVHRIVAPNPAELSRRVADQLLPIGGVVALASQANFPDALAGGAHAAAVGGTLLLTHPTQLSPEAGQALQARRSSIRQLLVYGGTAAVSDGVFQQARTAAG
jgi:putative cell wall-binding protein